MDCDRTTPAPMPLDEALARIARDHGAVTGTETVGLREAAGRILAEEVVAPGDVPPQAVSAMDGYGFAATAEDVPAGARYAVVGRIPAGALFAGAVGPGQAVRIFTGAAVPDGVNTVAMQEDCTAGAETVTLDVPVRRGANIRPAGEDLRAGTVVLRAGMRLRAQEVGLAASAGRAALSVRTRLRVALFSTGDELREPGRPKPFNTIYDSNRHTVGSQLAALGAEVRDLGIVPDRQDAVRDALAEAAAAADLVISTGGASVGEEDHVKAAVGELGRIDLWKLAIRPGKPVALGRVGNAAMLGLPGNPVSAMVTFMLIGRPLILRLSGAEATAAPALLAVAGFGFDKRAGRREFLRARLETGEDGRPVAHKFPNDSSGVLTSMVDADGLVDMAEGETAIRPGDLVRFLPFTGLCG